MEPQRQASGSMITGQEYYPHLLVLNREMNKKQNYIRSADLLRIGLYLFRAASVKVVHVARPVPRKTNIISSRRMNTSLLLNFQNYKINSEFF